TRLERIELLELLDVDQKVLKALPAARGDARSLDGIEQLLRQFTIAQHLLPEHARLRPVQQASSVARILACTCLDPLLTQPCGPRKDLRCAPDDQAARLRVSGSTQTQRMREPPARCQNDRLLCVRIERQG